MQQLKQRIVKNCSGLFAFGVFACLPLVSQAGGWDEYRPNRFQSINPGSYSPCHWWTPSCYRIHAYLRPARLYDQSEWDQMGGHGSVSGASCESPNPPATVQKKSD
jgi:hypothetical protein